MSFIAMYGVSVIFNYVLSNVVALIDTIIDKKYEINNIVAIVVCALYFFLIVWVYRNTTAFYGSGYNDVIYGSDSYTLTGSNVWLSLFQGQNDLRQPLYMLTAAPFMGIAYILGIILNCFYVNGLAIAYAFVQALLLVWSIWVLSHLISDNDIIRSLIILILSVCSSYCMLYSIKEFKYKLHLSSKEEMKEIRLALRICWAMVTSLV